MKREKLSGIELLVAVVAFVVVFVAIAPGIGYLVMLLWNSVVVSVFSAPDVSYWQAVGMWLIVAIVGACFRSVASK